MRKRSMARRRSQRVAGQKPMTPPPDVSETAKTKTPLRTLRSRTKMKDVDAAVAGSDIETRNKIDKEGIVPRSRKDANVVALKVTENETATVTDVPLSLDNSSSPAVEILGTDDADEANSNKENETVDSPDSPLMTEEDKKESEEDAKSTFLDVALGLRKSPSNSPEADKKPVSKIRDATNSKITDEPLDVELQNEEAPQPTTPPPCSPTIASVSTSTTDKPSETDSSKTKDAVATQPPPDGNNDPPPSTLEPPVAKLRSSLSEEVGNMLAKTYRRGLKDMEEYSLNFLCQEVHHPVISCFRELSRADVSQIVGNSKLKKSCNTLEQSVIYLGLIDLMATANNSPFYGENYNAKFSKNVPGMVQRILLEFKNIIGMWALSGNDQLNSRYSLIINYLRILVPLFNKAGFDKEFSSILDCIEKEVTRLKSNHDKLKTMGNSPATTSSLLQPCSSESEKKDSQDLEVKPSIGDFFLNVNLNVKDDMSDDDEDITLIKVEQPAKIFGKPLKASPSTFGQSRKKYRKTTKCLVDSRDPRMVEDNNKPVKKKGGEVKKVTARPSGSGTSLIQPKALTSVFESTPGSSPKLVPAKRNASEELVNDNEANKKRKTNEPNSPVSRNEKTTLTIKSFFQNAANSTASNATSNSAGNDKSNKPAVNAFAIMMKRSREIAQQKKLTAAGPQVTALKVDVVGKA